MKFGHDTLAGHPGNSLARRASAQSSAPKVNAGGRVTRGKYEVRSELNSGTAGLIVRTKGAATGRLILTCAHVLGPAAIGTGQQLEDANGVYSPELSRCCGAECNRPIGQVVDTSLQPLPGSTIQGMTRINGVDFAMDAALIALAAKATATNDVPKIGVISAVRDLITEWGLNADSPLTVAPAQQIAVRKYGAVSGYTHGKLVGMALATVKLTPANQPTTVTQGRVLQIDAVLQPGETPSVEEYELDMVKFQINLAITDPKDVAALFPGPAVTATVGGSAKAPTLIVTARNFSLPGDSGAPIVDAGGQVIALLTSGSVQPIYVMDKPQTVDIPTGRSQAIFLRAALDGLNIELLPPGQKTSGAPVATPGIAIERGVRDAVDFSGLEEARAAVERSAAGARLSILAHRHFEEVRDLVHHRRRVLVTWHRHHGPGFVNAFIKASSRPGWPVPRDVAGVSLVDALRAMRDVLLAEGTASLRAAIAENEAQILSLAARAASLDDVIRYLSPAPPLVRIANSRGVPGTAAALVHDGAGTCYLLTNHHVVFGAGGTSGERVWALPEDGAETTEAVCLGPARTGQLGRVSFGGAVYFVDCALVELTYAEFPDWLRAALDAGRPVAAATAETGMSVRKHGPATGTTLGVVLDAAYPDHPFIDGRYRPAPGQILVGSRDPARNFSAAGDSGAAVLDGQGRILGLLWGSNESGEGIASPIAAVLDCLGVTLATAAAPVGNFTSDTHGRPA